MVECSHDIGQNLTDERKEEKGKVFAISKGKKNEYRQLKYIQY